MVVTFVSERFSFKTFFLGNHIFEIFGYANYQVHFANHVGLKLHEVGQV